MTQNAVKFLLLAINKKSHSKEKQLSDCSCKVIIYAHIQEQHTNLAKNKK